MINYSINENGVLSVYYDNYIIVEISECNNMSDLEIISLIKRLFEESEFVIMKNKDNEKERFLELCYMYKDELERTNQWVEEERDDLTINSGTLVDLGCNVSYGLATIGLELGYASWQFVVKGNFKDIKKEFLDMVIENEKIIGCYTDDELKKIEERIKKCKKNI